MIYLAAACVAAAVIEVRLNFVAAPFNIPGRKDTYVLHAPLSSQLLTNIHVAHRTRALYPECARPMY